NRTCSYPAYGCPIIFTPTHASAPIGGVLWNGIQAKLFVEFSRRPPAKSKPLNLSSPSVLKVASQNRIFASGVYRQFPAPDFNRLVAMLPRHTVTSCILINYRPKRADIGTDT